MSPLWTWRNIKRSLWWYILHFVIHGVESLKSCFFIIYRPSSTLSPVWKCGSMYGDDNFWPVQGLNLVDCQSCSHCENLIKRRIVRAKAAEPNSVLLRPSIHNRFNSLCAVSLPTKGFWIFEFEFLYNPSCSKLFRCTSNARASQLPWWSKLFLAGGLNFFP